MKRSPVLLLMVALGALVAGCRYSERRPSYAMTSTPAPVEVVTPAPASTPPTAAAPAPAATAAAAKPVLYENLGKWHRAISTNSPDAQKAFDQALTLAFAFNHDEAIRLYGEAAKHDPKSAMPYWGIAFANGPHINNPAMPPERSRAAWEAFEKARSLASSATPVERDLIDAVGKRYAAEPPADRRPLDEAFAEAMRACWRAHPDDPDVGTLCAESLMDLQPWDLWTIDGKPKGNAEEIVATIEAVLARWPDHPGANHLYIHAVEASPKPERAVVAADRLGGLVPDAGHLVHMPAHIFIRVGRFADASKANELAIATDRRNESRFPRAGFYRIYMAHNPHFLSFASMMEGRYAAALEAARAVPAGIPREFIEQSPLLIDGFMPTPLHVMVRFGRWDDILKEPELASNLKVSASIRHYARGVALSALKRPAEARAELKALEDTVAAVPAEQTIGQNNAKNVLGIAVKMLTAEVSFREGQEDAAFATFREAIAIEDGLTYDEPPDWMQPVRHAYGATLLAAKRFEPAEAAFREDLLRYPDNGWSLGGLSRCLRAKGATDEAKEVAKKMSRAFARADIEIATPCFCQPGESTK